MLVVGKVGSVEMEREFAGQRRDCGFLWIQGIVRSDLTKVASGLCKLTSMSALRLADEE
ncbi:MAG: hypothetical protein JNL67_21990 [Planctomycetaceae bacterium]|nr:hypothetical protein [Planctomycetaceae bacterium]